MPLWLYSDVLLSQPHSLSSLHTHQLSTVSLFEAVVYPNTPSLCSHAVPSLGVRPLPRVIEYCCSHSFRAVAPALTLTGVPESGTRRWESLAYRTYLGMQHKTELHLAATNALRDTALSRPLPYELLPLGRHICGGLILSSFGRSAVFISMWLLHRRAYRDD